MFSLKNSAENSHYQLLISPTECRNATYPILLNSGFGLIRDKLKADVSRGEENTMLGTKRLTTAELIRNFGSHSDAALAEPIIITKNGRDRLVLISIEQYNLLRQALHSYEGAQARSRQDHVSRPTRSRTHVKIM